MYVSVYIPSTVKVNSDVTVPSELLAEHEKLPVSLNTRLKTLSVDVTDEPSPVEVVV